MKKTISTKRSLLLCALSILMCVSMLVGSTFAWFTDEVVSAGNVIKSGSLDIDVQYTLDGETWNNLDGAKDLFQKGLWEPGHTEVVGLKITNVGTLALKYTANMNIIEEKVGKNKNGGDIVLSDILTVATVAQEANQIGDILLGLVFAGSQNVAMSETSFKAGNVLANDMELQPGASHYVIVTVDMAETVGNEANHDGVNAPYINFGVNVFATQFTYEEDSFGKDYDKNAPEYEVCDMDVVDGKYVINTPGQLLYFANSVNEGNTYEGDTIVLANDIDLAGIDMQSIGTSTFERTTEGKFTDVNVFSGTFDGQEHTISNLTVDALDSATSALFGVTSGATIKNVNVYNAYINSSCASGVIVARAAKATKIDNCHVSGRINVYTDWAYAGGICGYGYADITNCSVIAEGKGVIKAANKNAVGGIVGWTYGAKTTGCEVENLDLTGWANIGSIAGWINSGHELSNCSAKNVNLTKTRENGHASIGIAAGGWLYNAKNTTTVSDNEFTDITLNGTYVFKSSANVMYGSEYYGSDAVSVVAENNETEKITNNLIEIAG